MRLNCKRNRQYCTVCVHSTPSCSLNIHTVGTFSWKVNQFQMNSLWKGENNTASRSELNHYFPSLFSATDRDLDLIMICPYFYFYSMIFFFFFATFLNLFIYFLSSERPGTKAFNWHWGNSRPDCKGLSLRTTENTVLLQQGATAVQSSEVLVWTQCQKLRHLFQSAHIKRRQINVTFLQSSHSYVVAYLYNSNKYILYTNGLQCAPCI